MVHRSILTSLAICFALSGAGCGGTNGGTGSEDRGGPSPDGRTAAGDGTGSSSGKNTFVALLTQNWIDKLDLLFVVDNSTRMADLQAVLKEDLPDLAMRLVNPPCVDRAGLRSHLTPANPTELCAAGNRREFPPIADIHVGLITSSLGGPGCVGAEGAGIEAEMANDHGRLVASRPRWAATLEQYPGGQVPEPAGFLRWNTVQGAGDLHAFNATLQAMVGAAGEFGCAVAAPLESAYRFLSDPEPGDDLLLAQRAAFLRQDSLVVVVLVSNQNDRSMRPTFDQLYPTARYANAFRSVTLCRSRTDLDPLRCPSADLARNPLFEAPDGAEARSPSLVHVTGIVGVPWQDIAAHTARDECGNVFLIPMNELHYKTPETMSGDGTWGVVLGEPDHVPPIPPRDALMVESITPRTGEGPLGADSSESGTLHPPGAPVMANPANGHERIITAKDDLQYACIFPLRPGTERDCAAIDAQHVEPRPGCDCWPGSEGASNPVCQDGTGHGNVQRYAKAYPGLRQLGVLKALGSGSAAASICARNLVDIHAQDYGYRAAVDSIVDRLKAAPMGLCLPREIAVADGGEVPCRIIEARPSGECDPAEGRRAVDAEAAIATRTRLAEAAVCGGARQAACDTFNLCELQPAGTACRTDELYEGPPGWCYVDPGRGIGNPSLVAKCPPAEPRILRFVDPRMRTPAPDATVLIECQGR